MQEQGSVKMSVFVVEDTTLIQMLPPVAHVTWAAWPDQVLAATSAHPVVITDMLMLMVNEPSARRASTTIPTTVDVMHAILNVLHAVISWFAWHVATLKRNLDLQEFVNMYHVQTEHTAMEIIDYHDQ